jgi:hypothetical protein
MDVDSVIDLYEQAGQLVYLDVPEEAANAQTPNPRILIGRRRSGEPGPGIPSTLLAFRSRYLSIGATRCHWLLGFEGTFPTLFEFSRTLTHYIV